MPVSDAARLETHICSEKRSNSTTNTRGLPQWSGLPSHSRSTSPETFPIGISSNQLYFNNRLVRTMKFQQALALFIAFGDVVSALPAAVKNAVRPPSLLLPSLMKASKLTIGTTRRRRLP